MIESITALDLSILDFIRNTLSSPVADIIMKCLTYSIEYGAMAILVFIVMMFVKKMRKTGFAVMGGTLSVLLFGELILKHIVCRPRPFVVNSAIDIKHRRDFRSRQATRRPALLWRRQYICFINGSALSHISMHRWSHFRECTFMYTIRRTFSAE